MSLEAAALAAAKSVMSLAAKRWLGWQREKNAISTDLTDMIKVGFPDQLVRRRTERQLEAITDSVYERLMPLIQQEFRGVDQRTRTAALRQVTLTFADADLSDKALLGDDLDPLKLARRLRETIPAQRADFELGGPGARLYEILLDESCDCLAHLLIHLPPFTERAAAESLSRLSEAAGTLETILARLPERSLEAPEGSSQDDEFTRRYLAAVAQALDRLELYDPGFERLKRPRTPLSVAYISLSVTDESAARRREIRDPLRIDEWRAPRREPDTVRVERALGERPRTLIRGEAGGGKTTLLRWLAVTAALSKFTDDLTPLNGCVPFLIKLRTHSVLPKPDEFLDDVAPGLAGLMPRAWVHRQLASGRALLLVDGIDEIEESRRPEARSWLAGLTVLFPRIRVVVTSRPAAAEADWLSAEGFGTAFLEPLGPTDLPALIRNWHRAVSRYDGLPCPPEQLPSYEARLLARMKSSPHLRALASTPLLAAMLCALNLDREDALPRNRMGLYAAAVTMLIDARDAKRGVPAAKTISLESGEKLLILQDLAWHLQSNDIQELPRTTAERLISERLATMPQVHENARRVLEALLERSGVLREPRAGQIDFVHRSVHEYLAARRAADLGDMDLLIGKAHLEQWRETVLMALGLANEPLRETLITGIAHRARTDAAHATRLRQLIVSSWETLPSVSATIREILNECLGRLMPPGTFDEARALATAGKEALARLPATLDWLTEGQAACCVQTAWLVNGPEALDILQRYAGDRRPAVEWEISRAWRYFDVEEYTERVLATRPPGGSLHITDSARRLSALSTVAPLARLQVSTPEPTDFGFLSRHTESLRFLRVSFGGTGADLASIPECPHLEELSLGAPGMADLSFLHSLPQLAGAWLTTCEEIRDYSPLLRFTALESLSLMGSVHLRDLGQLPSLEHVRSLGLAAAGLRAGALEDLVKAGPRVTHLALVDCDWVGGLGSLSALRLSDLRLGGCAAVSDVRPLAGQAGLRRLDLSRTAVTDLSALESLTGLSVLELTDCPGVRDLSPLAALPRLRQLRIQRIARGCDLSPLHLNRQVRIHIDRDQHVRGREILGERLRIT